MIRSLAVALGLVSIACVAPSHAGTLGTSDPVTISIVGTNASGTQTAPVQSIAVNQDDGTFAGSIQDLGAGMPIWEVSSLTIDGDTDPFVNLDFTITNVSDSPADITLSAEVPLAFAFPGPNAIAGEFRASITDTNDDGLITLNSVGATPVFVGTVDGTDALPIAVGGISLSSSQTGGTFTIGPQDDADTFGDALSTIGIDILFTVSAGDTATINSSFSLNPVPEPAALSLLAIGVVGIAGRRRR